MADEEQKRLFSKNLNKYLSLFDKTQKEVADAIGVSPQTFNTWCQGIALPRMGKVQLLADYFGIGKTDLIDEKEDNVDESNTFIKEDINLSDFERMLLEKYRTADTISKEMVHRALGLNISAETTKVGKIS